VRFHLVGPQRIEELLAARGVEAQAARLIAGLADGRPGRAVAMAQRPYLLEMRAQVIALADELFEAPLQAALALAARTADIAARLWDLELAAILEQERQGEASAQTPADAEGRLEAQGMRISHARAMRRAAPQVLNMMVTWLRDIMVAKSGSPRLMINRDYEPQARQRAQQLSYDALRRAIDVVARTGGYIGGYVSLDAALESMYVELAEVFAAAGAAAG
jgi:hypothetical protein